MSRTSEHHHKLVNGKGKCSVPMWCGGSPAGFCDKPAFGEPTKCRMIWNAYLGEYVRDDNKYNGYAPGLVCVGHGGPPCPGLEIEDGIFSGCNQSGGDCPTCGK